MTDHENLFKRWEVLKEQEKNLWQSFDSPGIHAYRIDPNSGKLMSEILGIERELKEKYWNELSSLDKAALDIEKWRKEVVGRLDKPNSHE